MKKLSFILGLVFLLVGCATQPSSPPPLVTPNQRFQLGENVNLTERQKADLIEAILAADIAEHNNDYLTAMSYYLFAAELSKNQQLIDKTTQMARLAKDPLGLEQAANIWLQVAPDHLDATTLLLEAQLEQQNMLGALQTASQILNQLPSKERQYEFIVQQVLKKDPRVANFFLQEMLNQNPADIALITAQAKFFFNLAISNSSAPQFLDQAKKLIDNAVKIDPLFGAAIKLKTHILFQTHRDEQAKTYLKQLLRRYPENPLINQTYGQLLYDLQNYTTTINHFERWLKKQPDDLESTNYLAASYYALALYPQSLRLFKQLIDANYHLDTSAFYCGDSAQKLTDITQAIDCFSMVSQGRYLVLSKVQLAKLLVIQKQYEQALGVLKAPYGVDEQGQTQLTIAEINILKEYYTLDQAKQRLEQALAESPDNLNFLLKKIDLYQLVKKPQKLNQLLHHARAQFRQGEKLDRFDLAVAALFRDNQYHQLAIDWLNIALIEKPDDKDLLYTRALYKEALALYPEMIVEFKALLARFPDDIDIQNALGYTLADIGQDLKYAEQLINTALEGAPDNAAIIDSKGWVAFRLGKLEQAKDYLMKAFQLSPSAEGAAHLGEVLWISEAKSLAKEIWRKGLTIDKNNRLLLQTLERLNIEL